nr:unnamed protein product [Spirometra erinaceieuropaei]
MVVVVTNLLPGETTPSVYLLAHNSRLWFHEAELCSPATPRATASTCELNQVTAVTSGAWVPRVQGTAESAGRLVGWNTVLAPSLGGSVWYAADQGVDGTSQRHHRRVEAPPGTPLVSRCRDGSPKRHRRDAPIWCTVGDRGLTVMSNELAQRLDNLPIAADSDAAAAENASMENRWSPLRDTVQSTALAVLGRACRQHQDWFDDNDAGISNLLAEKNCLQIAYVHHSTDDNRAAFYRSRRHLQLRLRRHVKRRG